MGEMGLLGMQIPEEYGGAGMKFHDYVVALEEVARADASVGLTMASHNSLCTGHIYLAGNEAQKQKYLPRLASGKVLGGWGLTEPGSGSDAGAARTRAVRKAAPRAGSSTARRPSSRRARSATIYVVLASTSPEKKAKGLTAFIVERGHARLPHRQAHREDGPARLGHDRAGARGRRGRRRAAAGRDRPRLLRHAEDPRQGAHRHRRLVGRHRARGVRGGAPLRQGARAVRQADRRVPGDPAHAGRHGDRAGRRAAAGLARGLDAGPGRSAPPRESSIAKYYAARATMRACNAAVQIHGGYGYTREFDVERYLRDAKLAEIGEGTNEVQKMVIARELLRDGGRAAS